MRKRKLYLSELLTRCKNRQSFRVSILDNEWTYYNNVDSVINLESKKDLWKREVQNWYVDNIRNYIVITLK